MQEGFFDYCSSLRRLKQRIPWGRAAFSLTQPHLPASLGSGGRLQRPLGAVLLPTKCTAEKTKSVTALLYYTVLYFSNIIVDLKQRQFIIYCILCLCTHAHTHMLPYSAGDYCVSLCGLSLVILEMQNTHSCMYTFILFGDFLLTCKRPTCSRSAAGLLVCSLNSKVHSGVHQDSLTWHHTVVAAFIIHQSSFKY